MASLKKLMGSENLMTGLKFSWKTPKIPIAMTFDPMCIGKILISNLDRKIASAPLRIWESPMQF